MLSIDVDADSQIPIQEIAEDVRSQQKQPFQNGTLSTHDLKHERKRRGITDKLKKKKSKETVASESSVQSTSLLLRNHNDVREKCEFFLQTQ